MAEVVQAFAITIQKFVTMLFSMSMDDGLSVGAFMLAVAILGAVIGIIFALVKVPGDKWSGEDYGYEFLHQKGLPDKGGKWTHNV